MKPDTDSSTTAEGVTRRATESPSRPVETSVGIVAIGRNEGDRLRACLASIRGQVEHVVYVDSGSTDGSHEFAAQWGARVVELDMTLPFTAARARNAGLADLRRHAPDVDYVQFVDGDCQVDRDWIGRARGELDADPTLAVVCGRRREIDRESTLYNRLCDLEWDTPVGEARACGGDAMMRITALVDAGGYNEAVIAGEEPELCFRMRQQGWRVLRLDAEMTRHDAAMTRFSQWWKRAVRSGHAYAEAAARHGASTERFGVKPSLSVWLWAAIVPILIVATALPTDGWSLALFGLYPIQVAKVAKSLRARAWSDGDRWLYATSCVLAKWPQLQGQCRYLWNRLRGRRPTIIEYKGVESAAQTPSPPAPLPRTSSGGEGGQIGGSE